MSADYEIFGALAGGALALAFLPIIGAGYAIYKGTGALMRLAEQERNRKAEEERVAAQLKQVKDQEVYNKMCEMQREYQTIMVNCEKKQREVADGFYHQMKNKAADFDREMRTATEKSCRALTKKTKEGFVEMQARFNRQREVLAAEAEKEISTAFSGLKNRIDSATDSFRALKAMNQRDTRLKTYAEQKIKEAEALLLLYQAESGENCDLFAIRLNEAVRYIAEEQYELAYTHASAVSMDILQKLEETKVAQLVYYKLCDDIYTALYGINERLSIAKEAPVTIGDDVLGCDLTVYEPELFKGCTQRAAEFQKKYESLKQYRRNNIPVLRMLAAECAELDDDICEISKLAVAKCVFSQSENRQAAIVDQALAEQGYQMLDYAYESNIEGNAMHVNYENPITKEKLTVVLVPSETGVQVSVHNYGDDGNIGNASSQRAIQNAIENKMNSTGRCTGLGRKSAYTSESNLEDVKSRESSTLGAAMRLAKNI